MPARYFEQTLPDSSTRFRMVQIPGGTFLMGSAEGTPEASEREFPQHKVTLSDFWMGEYPVTQALWEAVMGDNPVTSKDHTQPVERVNWFDAAAFCNRLSKLTDLRPAYLTLAGDVYGLSADEISPVGKAHVRHDAQVGGYRLPTDTEKIQVCCDVQANGYRLPTEAEWEYAARGGPYWIAECGIQIADSNKVLHTNGYSYAGSDLLDQTGWFHGKSGDQIQQVGLLIPNTLGLYDMSGNIWEWCQDWYGDYAPDTQQNPSGPASGSVRVLRGGSWNFYSQNCRVANRYNFAPGARNYYTGFRLARAY